jgi:hypothetical protein
MRNFSVVQGNKEKTVSKEIARVERKEELWLKTLMNLMENAKSKDDLARLVCAGVRCFSIRDHGKSVGKFFLKGHHEENDPYAVTEVAFRVHQLVTDTFASFSPAKIVQLFPQKKVYDGDKYECKDWYTSVEAVKEFGGDRSFAGDTKKASIFLTRLNDILTAQFVISGWLLVDDLRKMEGKLSMLDEFFSNEHLPKYRIVEGNNGKIFVDENGKKVGKVEAPKPRWARVEIAQQKSMLEEN